MRIFNVPINKRNNLEILIDGWNETMIWSCIQGYMGEAYSDSIENPRSAQFVVADFCFFAGVPNKELVENMKVIKSNFTIMTSNNEEWNHLIEEVYPENSKKITRYAIKKEKDIFDREKLQRVVNGLNSSYELKLIDEEIYKEIMMEDWSKDLCSQFINAKDYCSRGIGVVAVHNNKVVAGASSYTVFDHGIEIEIDTKIEYRRRGLAYATGAKLILECLSRGLYPSWDAQNLWSVALSEKLGYHFDHEYIAYEVSF